MLIVNKPSTYTTEFIDVARKVILMSLDDEIKKDPEHEMFGRAVYAICKYVVIIKDVFEPINCEYVRYIKKYDFDYDEVQLLTDLTPYQLKEDFYQTMISLDYNDVCKIIGDIQGLYSDTKDRLFKAVQAHDATVFYKIYEKTPFDFGPTAKRARAIYIVKNVLHSSSLMEIDLSQQKDSLIFEHICNEIPGVDKIHGKPLNELSDDELKIAIKYFDYMLQNIKRTVSFELDNMPDYRRKSIIERINPKSYKMIDDIELTEDIDESFESDRLRELIGIINGYDSAGLPEGEIDEKDQKSMEKDIEKILSAFNKEELFKRFLTNIEGKTGLVVPYHLAFLIHKGLIKNLCDDRSLSALHRYLKRNNYYSKTDENLKKYIKKGLKEPDKILSLKEEYSEFLTKQ